MIAEETKVSTELVDNLKNTIYNIIISEFITYSNDEVKSKIINLINAGDPGWIIVSATRRRFLSISSTHTLTI